MPHPFDLLKLKRLKASELAALSDRIDIIEAFNGKPQAAARKRARSAVPVRRTTSPAAPEAIPTSPHTSVRRYVEMEDFDGPEDLLEKLSRWQRSTESCTARSPRLIPGSR